MHKDILKIKVYDDSKKPIYSFVGNKAEIKEALDDLFKRKM
jgi:hypothetical protein